MELNSSATCCWVWLMGLSHGGVPSWRQGFPKGTLSAPRQPLGFLLGKKMMFRRGGSGFFFFVCHHTTMAIIPVSVMPHETTHLFSVQPPARLQVWVCVTSTPFHEEIFFNKSRCSPAPGMIFFCIIFVTGTSPASCVKPSFDFYLFQHFGDWISSLAPGACLQMKCLSPVLISQGPSPKPHPSLGCTWGQSQVRLLCTWGELHLVLHLMLRKSPQRAQQVRPASLFCDVLSFNFPSMWLLCC